MRTSKRFNAFWRAFLKASKASPRLTRLDISSRDLHRLSLTIVRHTGVAAEDSGVHHSEGLAQDSGPCEALSDAP